MGRISSNKLEFVRGLYEKGLSMREIGQKLNTSLNAVVYFMRKNNIQRRSFSEINRLRFDKKKPSFSLKTLDTPRSRELQTMGAMLYWGEGYKSEKATFVDFANSDPEMISVFLRFLRGTYELDPRKFRILLYCYSSQNVELLIRFWSRLTGIPPRQFTKPYIRGDFKPDGRKMEHGLIHVRYIDKKLLLELKSLIQSYKEKYAPVG